MMDIIKTLGSVILAVIGVFIFIGVGAALSLVGTVIGFIAVAAAFVIFLAAAIHQWLSGPKH